MTPGEYRRLNDGSPRKSRKRISQKESIYDISLKKAYDKLVDKALRRGHSSEEVDSIIRRFTGYSQEQINSQLDAGVRYQVFLENAPQIDPKARNLKGVINGMRVENIEEPLMQLICWLEKLVDDMSRGKA